MDLMDKVRQVGENYELNKYKTLNKTIELDARLANERLLATKLRLGQVNASNDKLVKQLRQLQSQYQHQEKRLLLTETMFRKLIENCDTCSSADVFRAITGSHVASRNGTRSNRENHNGTSTTTTSKRRQSNASGSSSVHNKQHRFKHPHQISGKHRNNTPVVATSNSKRSRFLGIKRLGQQQTGDDNGVEPFTKTTTRHHRADNNSKQQQVSVIVVAPSGGDSQPTRSSTASTQQRHTNNRLQDMNNNNINKDGHDDDDQTTLGQAAAAQKPINLSQAVGTQTSLQKNTTNRRTRNIINDIRLRLQQMGAKGELAL